ncbi:MAG: T9SS type A sorting domain-containing protein [Bacteroidia bacterium]
MRIKHLFKRYIGVLSFFTLGYFFLWSGEILTIKKSSKERGENPGYFEQWFNEKKDANGNIPQWMRTKWQAEDKKLNINKRANSPIFDTIIELGPAAIGGRTRALWIDPADNSHMLAAAISGGIWKTTTGGNMWEPLNDHETSLMSSCITSNPFNHDIIYYGTGESRANSAGVNGDGIFKSTNRGQSFDQLSSTVGLSGMTAIWDIAHSLDDSLTLFAGTHTAGLYRTQDGGETWDNVYNGGTRQINDILVLPNGRILISMQANGVLASDSNGNSGTWNSLNFPNRPSQFRRIQMANCEKYPNVVYALFEGYGFSDPPAAFYKSSDGGRTWVKQTTPEEIGAGYQAYCVMLGVSHNDSNKVTAGGVRCAASSDGGQNWTSISGSHADHHSYANLNQSTDGYVIGTDGGMYECRYGRSSVVKAINTGYRVTQFYAGGVGFEGLDAIAGAQDNGTHYATGRMLTQYIFGGDGAYCHIGQQTGTVAYLSTQNQGIRRVDNFGTGQAVTRSIAANEFSTDGVSFINSYTMNESDEYMLFYRTNRGVYRTADGGNNWEKINTVVRSSLKALGVSHDINPVLYYGGNSAQLYKFENAGSADVGTEVSFNASVPLQITNDYLNFIEVNPKNKYQIFVAFSNFSNYGRVWKVSNLDSSSPKWDDISGNLPKSLPVNSVAVDPWSPEHYIFAGTDFGLYYTMDGGATWQKEMSIPNVAVHEVKIRNSDRSLYAFTHGRGMWYLKLKDVKTSTEKIVVNANIYPNPAHSKVIFTSSSKVSFIEILDLNGKLIKSQKFDNPSKKINFDVRDLPAAWYLINVQTENGNTALKLQVK